MSDSKDLTGLLGQYPEIVALALMAGGWILAYFSRRSVGAAIIWINEHSIRWSSRTRPVLSHVFGKALQQITYWGIITVFVILGLSQVGSGALSTWIDRLWALASHVLIAVLILAVAHILGSLARNLLSGLSGKVGLTALPRMAYGLVVGVGLITALSHLGLDVTFITQMLLIVVGIFFAGLALAFAIGARSLVANLAAQEELSHYKPGDRLVVEQIEGTVIEVNRTGLVLVTEQGTARVPASKLAETTILLISQDPGDE